MKIPTFRFKSKITNIAVLIFLIVVIIIAARLLIQNKTKDSGENQVRNRAVEVVSVAELQDQLAPLSLVGSVSSVDEVVLHSQAQGEVVRVNYSQGDSVAAGSVIAAIENASQQAALLQAEGSYASAEAALAKLRKGSRDEERSILEAQVKNAKLVYEEAFTETQHTLQSVYITIDDVVKNKTDVMFSNPDGASPKLIFVTNDAQLQVNTEAQRLAIGEMIENFNTLINAKNEDPLIQLKEAETNLGFMSDYLDDLARAVNVLNPNSSLSQTTINEWKGAVSTARGLINSSLVQTSAALTNLDAKQTALLVAEKQLEQGVSGGRDEDIAAAEAGLTQALGALRSAQAQYEKTIIRTPISGTLNTLSIEKGDFLSLFAEVGIVANNNLLEIKTYITDEDRKWIARGARVIIEGGYEGVVYDVAPALDRATKKIEVNIAIDDAKDAFVNGSSVRVYIDRTRQTDFDTLHQELIVPISSVKIKSSDMVVYTVDAENKLVEHVVEKGSIVGDSVIILNGLNMDMFIVRDARGLKAGQEVEISEHI